MQGLDEGRNMNGRIDIVKYREEYEDLQEAFGDDILALWNHYQTSGATEGREARSEAVIVAEKEAQRAAEEARRRQESQGSQESQAHTEREEISDGWIIREYDNDGNFVNFK